MGFYELHDGTDELIDALERAAADAFVCDLSEPMLNQIEPGTARWNDVKSEQSPYTLTREHILRE